MADNAASGNANGQYSGKPVFGFPGQSDSTGAEGSAGGSVANDQYSSGNVPGYHLDDQLSTGAPGSEPHTPPSDGGTVSATDVFGILNGGTPETSGTSNTNAESLDEPFTHQNQTSTGAGHGTVSSSHTSPADQSSPWVYPDKG